METWERIWLWFLVAGFSANFLLMAISPKRGYFTFWYAVVFVLSGLPLIFALGQAEIDGQCLWVEMSAWWFKATKKTLPNSREIYKGSRRWLFISNHSSLADMCMNDLIYGGRCSNLARHMVIFFVPIPSVVVLFINSIFFFQKRWKWFGKILYLDWSTNELVQHSKVPFERISRRS